MQSAGQGVVQNVFHQRALPAAADTGHGGQQAQGDLDVDVFEIVVSCADDLEHGIGYLWFGRGAAAGA